jgi:hypothetical protein
MTLRHARLETGRPTAATRLDGRVCDCCPTTAVHDAAGGLTVAYRDRSDAEVRDMSTVRRAADGGWSEPLAVHADGWTIPGCPVNGPALAAAGRRAAAAWFTAAHGAPRVLAAWSADSGAPWSQPAEVDAAEPLGRVGLARLAEGSAVVSWLAADGAIRLRRLLPDGRLGPAVTVAVTAASRAAGVPRLVATGDRLHAAWVEPGGDDTGSHLRFATQPAAAVPPPA